MISVTTAFFFKYKNKLLFDPVSSSCLALPEPGPSTLGSMLMPSQETEWEELIRTGHMTPFGTRIPQKVEKKEPKKLMMMENSAFDQYLTDQAQLATDRKRPAPQKNKKSPVGEAKKRSNGTLASPIKKDKKLQKRMRKLQITALKAHPRARPKAEPRPPKPRKRPRAEGEETDSEGSEYLPSDEGFDPDKEAREDIEEGFGGTDDEEYEMKPYKRKSVGKGQRKQKKREHSEEEYCPDSSEEEGSGKKGKKETKCRDDGDLNYYKQRIR